MITPGEIHPGMFLTVYEWEKPAELNFVEMEQRIMFSPFICGGRDDNSPTGDKAWMGRVLAVEAVSLPYVCIRVLPEGRKAVLDTRKCSLMEVSVKYAKALIGSKEKAKVPAVREGAEPVDVNAMISIYAASHMLGDLGKPLGQPQKKARKKKKDQIDD